MLNLITNPAAILNQTFDWRDVIRQKKINRQEIDKIKKNIRHKNKVSQRDENIKDNETYAPMKIVYKIYLSIM